MSDALGSTPSPFRPVEQTLEAIEDQLIGINDQLSVLNELLDLFLQQMASE
jgi:hypothetical protein